MIACCTSPLSYLSWEQLVRIERDIIGIIIRWGLICFCLELLDNKKYEGQILRADPAEVIIEKQE